MFGPDDGVNPAEWDGDNHFLYVDWKVAEAWLIGAYGYYIDVDSQQGYGDGKTVNNSEVRPRGLEYVGKVSVLNLRAAYASQADAGDSEPRLQRRLLPAGSGWQGGGHRPQGGRLRSLAAGDGTGFVTPLATLHKFQGWADKFLSTPATASKTCTSEWTLWRALRGGGDLPQFSGGGLQRGLW